MRFNNSIPRYSLETPKGICTFIYSYNWKWDKKIKSLNTGTGFRNDTDCEEVGMHFQSGEILTL